MNQLPAWNNATEYQNFTAPEFIQDIEQIQKNISEIQGIAGDFSQDFSSPDKPASTALIQGLQRLAGLQESSTVLLQNLMAYTQMEMSLDATNTEAVKTDSRLNKLITQFKEATSSYDLYLNRTTNENLKSFLDHPKTKTSEFYWKHSRTQKDFLLSEAEENLVSALSSGGHKAWGNLYDSLSGTMRCHVEIEGKDKVVSLAEAHALTRVADESTRKMAWHSIQKTWNEHRETAAAILNALAEWRSELNKKRSSTKTKHFLNDPLYSSRIRKETLEAMYSAIEQNRLPIQAALKKMAKYLGKEKLAPWDLLAPAPVRSSEKISFEEGFRQIKDSFTAFNPEMGDFAQLMLDQGWIDARVLPNKRNGAYCSGFAKSKTPRVFQTYMGSSQDVSTLAHEIGHAYHSWVMRDQSPIEQDYPMTLAETASIFSEQVLFQYQLKNAKSAEEKLGVAWSLADSAVGLLLNIGTRFEFEKNFYQRQPAGYVSADELSEIMSQAFEKWYGDSLSQTDSMFWAHKLHFSIVEISFYNFPYTFGYLFSLSLFARQKDFGPDFHKKYVEILRDTGRMTAEDLIKKHLDEDITSTAFWQKSLDVVIESLKML